MSRLTKLVGTIRPTTATKLKAAVLLCFVAVVVWQGYGFRFLGVQSDSMAPSFHHGDMLFVRNVTAYDTKVGDVVSYRSSENASVIITHRVVAVDPIEGFITTKGDANEANDQRVDGHLLIGRSVLVIPAAGRVSGLFRNWWGLAAFVYVPMALLVGREFVRLGRHYTQPTYRIVGRPRNW